MSLKKCVKCNIDSNSKECKFKMYMDPYPLINYIDQLYICEPCNMTVIYEHCIHCGILYSETISNILIKPDIPLILCHKCYEGQPTQYISKIFSTFQIHRNEQYDEYEKINDINSKLEAKINNMDDKIIDVIKNLDIKMNIKIEELEKIFNEKIEKNYEKIILGDEFVINTFKNKLALLKLENVKLENVKLETETSISLQEKQINEFNLLNMNHIGLKLQLVSLNEFEAMTSEKIELKEKCILDIQGQIEQIEQIENIDNRKILFTKTCLDIKLNKNQLSQLNNTIYKNKQKINRIQHFILIG
jgi:hypothetical protein